MKNKKAIKTITSPNSKESEMMVLGSMLTSINSLNVASDSLESNDFFYSEHRIIFDSLKEAFKKDQPADVHLIAESLKRQNKLEEVGGISYLTTLAQYAGTSAFIEEYIKIIRDKSILRKMIEASQIVEKNAIEDPEDVHSVLDDAQLKFFEISQSINRDKGLFIKDILSGMNSSSKIPYLKELQERQEKYQQRNPSDVGITGIPTHFADLDKLIDGLNKANLMILAARPAMGKTAFAINIAENVCFKSNKPVGIFSLEMTAEQLLHRMICSQSEVESEKIKTGAINGAEYQRIVSSVNEMINCTMIIDDHPGLKITDLRARARRMKEAHDIQLLIIDYLQLIAGSGSFRSAENRQNEISEISRMLKNLARELQIPVLCLSQLSRKVEERTGHRPMMSDLRESGCLTGDTLIKLVNGKLITIKELAERKNQETTFIYSVDEKLKVKKHKMIKAFYSGKKVVYKLTTKSGKTIKASANHKFLKLEGWERLDKLKIGDTLACLKNNLSEIYWDEIISIEELGIEDVYDATVEQVHNFVANDIIVHNSLEQDSDLVFFLLRREYYDPYDKPNHAELIIAKNRHGSIGSVNLTFRKELAQFANYTPINESNEEMHSLKNFS